MILATEGSHGHHRPHRRFRRRTASEWYQRAFGATEESRGPLPGGKVMTLVLRFGTSAVHVASEFGGWRAPLGLGGGRLRRETDMVAPARDSRCSPTGAGTPVAKLTW